MSRRLTGWVPMDAAAWPLVVDALTVLGDPWPDELCRFDLRWLWDTRRGRLPGRGVLRRRWGRSDWSTRVLLRAVDAWADPYKALPVASRTPPGGLQVSSRTPPDSLQNASRMSPGVDSMNADNLADSSRTPPECLQNASRTPPDSLQVSSIAAPAGLLTRIDPQPQSQPQPQPQRQPQPRKGVDGVDAVEVVAPWLRNWLKGPGKRLAFARSRIPAVDVLAAVGRVLEEIRGKPVTVRASTGRPVLRLWVELLDDPELELAGDLSALVDPVVLIADACRRAPGPMFARDIRAEGWPDGTDRSRNVAAICRLAPKGDSTGATWSERLDAASVWRAAGSPVVPVVALVAGAVESFQDRIVRLAGVAS